MSGSSIPYHLRVNKHIDREIFVESMRKISQYTSIDEHEYIGFGAAHLHDFKYIHTVFGLSKMHSLEIDPGAFQRQLINRQFSCISCNLMPSSEFVENFPKIKAQGSSMKNEIEKPIILWLDYTKAADLEEQLTDFKSMIEKSINNSIIKITLNAHYQTLGEMNALNHVDGENQRNRKKRLEANRFKTFQKRLGKFSNDIIIKPEDFNEKTYVEHLHKVLSIISEKATEGLNRKFIKLTSSSYADGQAMLTFTGIVLSDSTIEDFFTKTGFQSWEFYTPDNFSEINVPSLSSYERHIIDKYLPNKIDKLMKKNCVKNFDEFSSGISNYQKYYRQYPNFLKGQI